MLSEKAILALQAELREIDEQLRAYDALVEKRKDIAQLLGKWVPGERAASILGRPSHVGFAFTVQDGSKAHRIAQAARDYLERQPHGVAPFLDVLTGVPEELLEGPNGREYARTALRRLGADFGILYEDAENVRLVSPSNQERLVTISR